MPMKSKAQHKKLFAMAARGEISEKKVREMARKTKSYKKLPAKKKPAKKKATRKRR